MFARISSLAIMIILLISPAYGERIEIGKSVQDVLVTLEESNDLHTVIRYEISAFSKEPVDVNGSIFYSLSLEGENVMMQAGDPALPRICRSIIIPDDARMKVNVLASSFVDFEETPVISSKGSILRTVNPEDVPYSFGPVYSTDRWYPDQTAELGQPYILRDYRASVVQINPFQYNPVTRRLRVYTSLTVEIAADGPGEVNVIEDRKELRLVPEFDRLYSRRFINYTQAQDKYTPVQESGDMLIITHDAFNSSMTDLVNWKRQKGIECTIVNVSTVGNTVSAIKNYIQNFYNTHNLAWILLVGDYTEIAYPDSSGGAADPCYAKLAGADNYPDAFIGRFSATNTTQVLTQVQRTVEYESDPQGASWFHKATGIASNIPGGHYGESDSSHMNNIRADLLAFTYDEVDQIYEPYGTATQISSALNTGRSFVNYCGHGYYQEWSSVYYNNTHVNALTNTDKLPFIHSVACQCGHFNGYDCFGEAWLRATYNGEPTGAVGAYMASRNQYWQEPMEAQDETTDLLVDEAMTTFGGICFNGSCWMMDVYPSSGYVMYNTWIIFGDPSILLRTATPAAITVNHDSYLLPGQTSFDVEVVGVEGALCALYDNGTLYGSAYTNSSGQATITINGSLTQGQNVTLTVTAFNKQNYFSTLEVSELCADPSDWENTWGDTLAQKAHSVVQTSDGGYAFCGRVGPYDAAILYSNIQLVKTDSCGEVEWTREYGGDSADWAYSIDVTEPDDGFIICGSTTSYGLGGSDIYLIKTDANGNVQWTQTHGTTGLDWGKSVKQTSDGGYIVVGTLPEHDFLILKLNQYGNTVWADTCFDFYGFEWYDPSEVIETNDGKFVVAGSGYDDYFLDYFIILFTWDSNGNQVGWKRYFYSYAHGYGVVQTSDNGFAICGYDADTSGANQEDFFILKTNSAGSVLWTQSYDINNCDIANSIKQLSDGGYIVVGESGYLYYGADMYVLRTDAGGNTIWGKTYGGAYRDDGKSIQICSDGGFVVAGCSYSFGDDENGDFYMVKIGPEPPAPILYSPVNGKYWYTTSMAVTLDWYDVDDAILYEVMLDNNNDFSSPIANPNNLTVSTWTTPTLGVGTYYWKVRAKNETGWGPWSSVWYFQLRTPTGGCPILFTFDGNDFRKENPLLTACEKSGYKDVVTDYYHLIQPPACEDGIATFQLRETVDEVTYLHDLELLTVDHSAEVSIVCAVDGSIMTYHEILTPLSAVDDQGRDQLASVIDEDGNFFTADEPGHLIVTFPNPRTDLTGFSFYALKKPIIEEEPPPGGKLLPYAEFNPSDLTIEILGNDNEWHEVEAQIPSREYLLQEMVLTDYASGIESDEITVRLSWSGRYATDVLLQYVPADEYPVIESREINGFDLRRAVPDQQVLSGFSSNQPLILRKGDILEYTFDVGPVPPEGLSRDYIIRAVGRYEPAGLQAGALPTQFQLYSNYPNPFNPATTIAYDLPTPSEVKLNVYNILGQLVATVYNGPQDAGHHEAIWDGNDSQGRPVASGVYIYHLEAGTFAASRKMVLMK